MGAGASIPKFQGDTIYPIAFITPSPHFVCVHKIRNLCYVHCYISILKKNTWHRFVYDWVLCHDMNIGSSIPPQRFSLYLGESPGLQSPMSSRIALSDLCPADGYSSWWFSRASPPASATSPTATTTSPCLCRGRGLLKPHSSKAIRHSFQPHWVGHCSWNSGERAHLLLLRPYGHWGSTRGLCITAHQVLALRFPPKA